MTQQQLQVLMEVLQRAPATLAEQIIINGVMAELVEQVQARTQDGTLRQAQDGTAERGGVDAAAPAEADTVPRTGVAVE